MRWQIAVVAWVLVQVVPGGYYVPMAGAGQSPNFERRLVVAGQGYFPVALRLQDSRIAVVLRGGGPHVGIGGRLDIVFSSDEGRTWTKPTVIVDTPMDDRNPAFGQALDGTLVVAFVQNTNYDLQGRYRPDDLGRPITLWITRFQDGGNTWSEPAQIETPDFIHLSPFGKMLTLPDGSMLMNVYGGSERGKDQSDLYRSTNHGKTWKRFSSLGRQFNETALVRLPSGKILAAMRRRHPQDVWITESSDGGKTWSNPKSLTPAEVHPADLCLLADGRVLMTVGYRVGPFGVMGLKSGEGGSFSPRNWTRRFTLVNDAISRDCGYPSSVLLKDGRVLTVYYAVHCLREPQWGVHCGAVVYRLPAWP